MTKTRIALLVMLCASHASVVFGQACCDHGFIKFKFQKEGPSKGGDDLKGNPDYKDWMRISDFSLSPNNSSSSGAVLKFTVAIGASLPQFIGALAQSEVVTETT